MTDKKPDQSVSQVAAICGCDAQTVRNWIAAGKIKAYQLGGDGAYRIPWAEVERAKAEWMYKPEISEAL